MKLLKLLVLVTALGTTSCTVIPEFSVSTDQGTLSYIPAGKNVGSVRPPVYVTPSKK